MSGSTTPTPFSAAADRRGAHARPTIIAIGAARLRLRLPRCGDAAAGFLERGGRGVENERDHPMKVLRIGVAPYEDMKARTMAIARGELKPGPDEPKLWFASIESLARVLSDKNRALIGLIIERRPKSLAELEAAFGAGAVEPVAHAEEHGALRPDRVGGGRRAHVAAPRALRRNPTRSADGATAADGVVGLSGAIGGGCPEDWVKEQTLNSVRRPIPNRGSGALVRASSLARLRVLRDGLAEVGTGQSRLCRQFLSVIAPSFESFRRKLIISF